MDANATVQGAAGWMERAMLSIGVARDRAATRFARVCARAGRLLLWALTLRLPGEFGYWLRARRLRAPPETRWTPRRFALSSPALPVVSVIVTSYGQVAMTKRCLASIAAHPPKAPAEVIVIDDASGDTKLARLARISGLRLLVTPRNLGFIGACNHAAGFARGEFLLFLNNDTKVRAGWLDSLLAVLRERQDAGAAGSKLLYPNGRLQEAGAVIWADGTGSNVGRGADPAAAEYNHVRAVDYCSGASLMVRAALFRKLGGFDPLYAPAYYEDADLSFRLRALGFATLYQPQSEVVHIEGASHGTDPRVGVKAHQVLNRSRFVSRWAEVLAADHQARGRNPIRAREHAAHRPIVLIVEHCAPEPDRDAGSQTVLAFIDALLAANAVVKLWVEVIRPDLRYVAALQDRGVEVIAGGPARFETWMLEHGAELDRVLLSRPEIAAAHVGALRRFTSAPIAYYGHDLHHRRTEARFAITGRAEDAREARRMETLERWLWRAVDTTIMPSAEECSAIEASQPTARVREVRPYAFGSFGAARKPPPGADLLFVGGFAHAPNENAVLWLAAEVLPRIRIQVPDARLIAAGSHVSARIWALAGPDVLIQPDVAPAELRALYRAARVAVAPLRYGAGVKLKVVEALREGTPLVTTSVGAQGLPGLDGIAAIHDDAAGFADAACRMLRDNALWEAACLAQISYARARFDTDSLAAGLLEALQLEAFTTRARPVSQSTVTTAVCPPSTTRTSPPKELPSGEKRMTPPGALITTPTPAGKAPALPAAI